MKEHYTETAEQIIDVAQRLIVERGYNAFSYADISAEVGIRKASIHYHFPAKSDLARAAVMRYRARIRAVLVEIDRTITNPMERLERYIEITGKTLQTDSIPQMCLCALLAAEFPTVPDTIRQEVQGFYADQEGWFRDVLQAGVDVQQFRVNGSIDVAAQVFLAGIQGAMLSVRACADIQRFYAIARQLVANIVLQP